MCKQFLCLLQQVSTDNHQSAREPDSSCSKQVLFIIPCSDVADKKNCASLMSSYLPVLFNRSLEKAYLPISQKAAIIKLPIKKRGLDTVVMKNYRPVSNLSFVFQLLERVISPQLTAFLEASNAHPVTQCAYRKFH